MATVDDEKFSRQTGKGLIIPLCQNVSFFVVVAVVYFNTEIGESALNIVGLGYFD